MWRIARGRMPLSGTKLIPGLLAEHPELTAVPYDINYVWRYGNEHVEHEGLLPHPVAEKGTRKIGAYLGKFMKRNKTVIGKTVSNASRLSVVDRVVPDARYVHVIRDGRDAVVRLPGVGEEADVGAFFGRCKRRDVW